MEVLAGGGFGGEMLSRPAAAESFVELREDLDALAVFVEEEKLCCLVRREAVITRAMVVFTVSLSVMALQRCEDDCDTEGMRIGCGCFKKL